MASNATQANRIAELTTPLGKDVLLLTSFHAIERLSSPFEVRIDCLSDKPDIDFNAVLGKNCSIRQTTVGKNKRYFNGVLTEAGWFGEREHRFAYQLVLRPWFWLLTQTTDCRIFQNKSVIDIIKKVFSDAGFNDFEVKVTETYKTLEYCVQYRETHFDFVSRLMETFGIYYYFKHTESKHVLVLADAKSSHEPVPGLASVPFAALGDRTRDVEEYLTQWLSSRRFRTGKVVVNAFDFVKPTADLKANKASPGGYAHDSMEVYDYPLIYKVGDQSDLGVKFASAKLYAAQSEDRRRIATGDAPSLFPGGLTKLRNHKLNQQDTKENQEYLVIAADHSFVAEQFRSGSETAEGDSYSGYYELQPSDRPYKAPALTPKPVIHGPQTAMVVGPSGEEIHTDEHGRIKLKFHWDRYAPGDDKSSRWVRVAQVWSGKQWGGIVIPRIGMEVIVDFIEGNPDRPLVVGTVYNGDNKVPFGLPDNKTQSGLISRSSKNATALCYNELVFEDMKDKEFVRFHAEKDLNSTIEDKETRLIKGKNKATEGETTRETTIERGDDVLNIKGDNKVDIGRHQKIDVGKTITITAGDQIVLQVGTSKITMTKTKIKVESGIIETKSAMKTEIDGGGSIIEKAGVIKLN